MTPQRAPRPVPEAPAPDHDIEDHDRGLEFDLQTLSRRGALAFLGTGLLAVAGCSSAATVGTAASATATASSPPSTASTASSAASSTSTTAATVTTEIPEETAGPYPGDGSNGPNVLTESGIVRSDIRSSFGSSTTTAEGVPLTVTLTCGTRPTADQALQGAAVYLWHCNSDGEYSLYAQGVDGRELPARRAGGRRRRHR